MQVREGWLKAELQICNGSMLLYKIKPSVTTLANRWSHNTSVKLLINIVLSWEGYIVKLLNNVPLLASYFINYKLESGFWIKPRSGDTDSPCSSTHVSFPNLITTINSLHLRQSDMYSIHTFFCMSAIWDTESWLQRVASHLSLKNCCGMELEVVFWELKVEGSGWRWTRSAEVDIVLSLISYRMCPKIFCD